MKITIYCENCNKIVTRKVSRVECHKYPNLCKACATSADAKVRYARYTFDMTTINLDFQNFHGNDSNNVSLPVKLKFETKCHECHDLFKTSLLQEKNKKHHWNCKACAIKKEWNNESYRLKHEAMLKLAANTESSKRRVSETSKKNWSDDKIRGKMLNRNFLEIGRKAAKTRYDNHISGKKIYKTTRGKRVKYNDIWMKSTYESRLANVFDKLKIKWEYECKWFNLRSGKCYLPDFYLPDFDLYVEVKGWWRDDAFEKFNDYLKEFDIKCSLVMKNELLLLEKGEASIEDFIKKNDR